MKEYTVTGQPTDQGVTSDTNSGIPISEWSDDFHMEFEKVCVQYVKEILINYDTIKAGRNRKAIPCPYRMTEPQRITESEDTDESSTVSQEDAIPPKAPSAKTVEETAPEQQQNNVPSTGEDDESSKERASRTPNQDDEETDSSDSSDMDEIPPPQRPEVTVEEQAVAKLCEMIYDDYRKLCTKTKRHYMAVIYKNWYNRIEVDSS
ncbi:hypothetical protein TNIN_35101 [Trichonephila inaurata madagascariensis]|uniref:Uncharacterized protein n=1 Tax=Trichonephila inaurata madagascariensis TaxID=2747483 RepID=A0A8X6YSZ9_9ARAC|nr:hypothetical protein TNIN_50601 [Trichonephila inaurata madagascariensis]GFY77214.1 hypothetical protein TNIN_35101 [Trichonephila inaurata madagascariensis]